MPGYLLRFIFNDLFLIKIETLSQIIINVCISDDNSLKRFKLNDNKLKHTT